MKKYLKHKNSGVPWLGDIPEHWEIKQLRSFLTLFSEKGHGDAQLLSVTRENGVILRDKDNKEENHNYVPEDLSGYKFIKQGDFVINKMKAWQGSYAVSDYEGIVSPAYYTCKLSGVNKEFFSKAIRSKAYIGFFASYSKGIRAGQWDLKTEALKAIPFFLPPIEEQEKIVKFIDHKTQEINDYIILKEKEIQLLLEYKQSQIADVVMHGLRSTSMKDSGIPWIGEIPESWEMKRVGSFLYERKEKYNDSEKLVILSLLKNIGVIPYEEKGNIGNKAKEDITTYKVTRKGDVVVNCMNVIIGSSGITDYDGYISPAYYSFVPINKEMSIIYKHWLSLPQMQGAIRCMAKGILEIRLRVSARQLLSMYIPTPPVEEQRAIVEYIDNKCKQIDSMIDKIKVEIAYLKELKPRLIADAVTGAINVQE